MGARATIPRLSASAPPLPPTLPGPGPRYVEFAPGTAAAWDALDGIRDGKFFGRTIVETQGDHLTLHAVMSLRTEVPYFAFTADHQWDAKQGWLGGNRLEGQPRVTVVVGQPVGIGWTQPLAVSASLSATFILVPRNVLLYFCPSTKMAKSPAAGTEHHFTFASQDL